MSIFQLVSVAEETVLKLTLSETPKTGFLVTGPKYETDIQQEDIFMLSQYKPMFGPKGRNLSKIGRGSLDDATHQITRL